VADAFSSHMEKEKRELSKFWVNDYREMM